MSKKDLCDNNRRANLCIIGVPEWEEGDVFKEVMADNSPDLAKDKPSVSWVYPYKEKYTLPVCSLLSVLDYSTASLLILEVWVFNPINTSVAPAGHPTIALNSDTVNLEIVSYPVG